MSDDALNAALAALKADFLDGCEDRLSEIGSIMERLDSGTGNFLADIGALKGLVHSIKGQAGTFGFPTVSLISHALEDFIDDIKTVEDLQVEPLQIFIDRIQDIVDSRENPGEDEAAQILKSLPNRDKATAKTRNMLVLLVMPQDIWRAIVGKELESMGFRVATTDASLKAIEMGVEMKPDLVVSAMVLDSVSGAELSHVFRSIKVTQKAHFVLVTSFDTDNEQLSHLPEGTALIKKGADFAKQFGACLKGWDLLS